MGDPILHICKIIVNKKLDTKYQFKNKTKIIIINRTVCSALDAVWNHHFQSLSLSRRMSVYYIQSTTDPISLKLLACSMVAQLYTVQNYFQVCVRVQCRPNCFLSSLSHGENNNNTQLIFVKKTQVELVDCISVLSLCVCVCVNDILFFTFWLVVKSFFFSLSFV